MSFVVRTCRCALIDLAVFIDAFVILPACHAKLSRSRSRADSFLFFIFCSLDRPAVTRSGPPVALTPHITARICCSVDLSRALRPLTSFGGEECGECTHILATVVTTDPLLHSISPLSRSYVYYY